MKKVDIIKGLAALALLATSLSASAIQVYLNQDGLRAGSGTLYRLLTNGDGIHAASTATWDWDGTTLTQTGGTLEAYQWIGSTSASGQWLLGDVVTGLTINTGTGVTTATSYTCVEGNFGAGTNANSCNNTAYGTNVIDESSVAYNVGGNAACEQRTIGGDDAAGGSVFRGLRSWNGTGAPCGGTTDGDNTGRGALDMIQIMQDNTGSGGTLILANANNPVIGACLNTGSASTIDPTNLCSRAHWLTFSTTVPVPAAAWLFGSAVGMLGWARRRNA